MQSKIDQSAFAIAYRVISYRTRRKHIVDYQGRLFEPPPVLWGEASMFRGAVIDARK